MVIPIEVIFLFSSASSRPRECTALTQVTELLNTILGNSGQARVGDWRLRFGINLESRRRSVNSDSYMMLHNDNTVLSVGGRFN